MPTRWEVKECTPQGDRVYYFVLSRTGYEPVKVWLYLDSQERTYEYYNRADEQVSSATKMEVDQAIVRYLSAQVGDSKAPLR
jgi:hypothetical protein